MNTLTQKHDGAGVNSVTVVFIPAVAVICKMSFAKAASLKRKIICCVINRDFKGSAEKNRTLGLE